jgi:hypothetical protein
MRTESPVNQWSQRLRAWGLNGLAATFLEQAGPLAFLGAQALYFTAPVLSLVTPDDQIRRWARLLEDPAAVEALAQRLAQEDQL